MINYTDNKRRKTLMHSDDKSFTEIEAIRWR